MSRKGKAAPSERRRGRNSPPANPERVTAGASERRGNGVHRMKSKEVQYSKAYKYSRCQIEETPEKASEPREPGLQRRGHGHVKTTEWHEKNVNPTKQSHHEAPANYSEQRGGQGECCGLSRGLKVLKMPGYQVILNNRTKGHLVQIGSRENGWYGSCYKSGRGRCDMVLPLGP